MGKGKIGEKSVGFVFCASKLGIPEMQTVSDLEMPLIVCCPPRIFSFQGFFFFFFFTILLELQLWLLNFYLKQWKVPIVLGSLN